MNYLDEVNAHLQFRALSTKSEFFLLAEKAMGDLVQKGKNEITDK